MEREGRIPVPGGEVWFRISGGGPGIPLLTLHGGPGANSAPFAPLAALPGRAVILYDQLGAGRSRCEDDPALWHIDRFTAEIAAVRAGLDLAEIHLLGHSWGGFLALEYMLSRPRGVCSLTLCSTAAGVPEYEREVSRLVSMLPEEMQAIIRQGQDSQGQDSDEYWGAVLAFLRRHLCRLDPWPDVLLDTNPADTPAYQVMWGPNEFTVTGNLKTWDRTERLAEITVPTLVTCGRHDEAAPACAETLARGISGATLHVFERSAHMAFLEETEEFLRVVGEFLASNG